jgi:hypothetical protein
MTIDYFLGQGQGSEFLEWFLPEDYSQCSGKYKFYRITRASAAYITAYGFLIYSYYILFWKVVFSFILHNVEMALKYNQLI